MPRLRIAALGAVVQRARDKGDAVAGRILEQAADELALGARSVAFRLDMRGDPFICVLAGGVFRAVPWLVDALSRRLRGLAPRADVRLLEDEPAVGAVRLALAETTGGALIPRYK
jgi:N-acetylglucosamine kinase-like BadF-type ATPase